MAAAEPIPSQADIQPGRAIYRPAEQAVHGQLGKCIPDIPPKEGQKRKNSPANHALEPGQHRGRAQ